MNATIESIDQQELAYVREQATRIIQFAQKNPAFLQRASQDPEGTLHAFGLSEQAISILRDPNSHPVNLPCLDTTCWSSACPDTCYISIWLP